MRHRPEVADVIAQAGAAHQARYRTSAAQRRILRALVRCRSAALGGHQQQCTQCGHEVLAYHSCRNRHCPTCQGPARARWLAARAAELLPVPYFHVVFTLPAPLAALALHHKRVVYGILFRAVAATLRTIARDLQHLGADIGFLAVLHTWGQTLQHHPHLHCVVPGGGLSGDGSRWIPSRSHFFLPVRVLSRHFRHTFLRLLRSAYQHGKLRCRGPLARLAAPAAWHRWLHELERTEWVVYAKPPFGGPHQVLKYLARYTHRVAISNQRLVAVADGRGTFRWKDYAHDHRPRTMTLDAVEFLRRFLLHRLPRGFQHIRHYGFLGNRRRAGALARIRELVGPSPAAAAPQETPCSDEPPPRDACPQCGTGRLVVVATLAPVDATHPRAGPPAWNTS
ncbi:MAG TPA: IS91 family transposase [Gemmatimonadales bacterium]|nr:IS91 family transposase [Gemmatimonadales bacterium]